MLDYRLIVVTNGRPCLREALESFQDCVRPQPKEAVLVTDGGELTWFEKITPWIATPWLIEPIEPAQGFCRATAAAWMLAAAPGPDWIFWLEDDFRITDDVDLEPMVEALSERASLAQMALYRDPVSTEEQSFGGYLNDPHRVYLRRETNGHVWLEHDHYWTTNPSLFPRIYPMTVPWPAEPECEGHFGIELKKLRPETTFGVWGDGQPQVRHLAERAGFGY